LVSPQILCSNKTFEMHLIKISFGRLRSMLLTAFHEYFNANEPQYHSLLLQNHTISIFKRTNHFKETCLKNGLQI